MVKHGVRKVKQGYRSHKLNPYRALAKAEKAAAKENLNFQYQKRLYGIPRLKNNHLFRLWQKQKIKKDYTKAVKKHGTKTVKTTAKKTAEGTRKTTAFVACHPAGVIIVIAALLLFIIVFA